MSTVTLTSSGCSGSATHNSGPTFYGSFSLSASLDLSVYISGDDNGGVSSFNYDVGYVATGSNGVSVSGSARLSYGTTPSGSYGSSDSVSLSGNLSGLTFPISLHFTCAGCTAEVGNSAWQNNSGWTIVDGRHTHIGSPGAPSISSTTGKTITVTNGSDGLYCTTNGSGWHGSTHTFTGLTQGTSYSFKCREYCPGCPDGLVLESGTTTGKTWSISGEFLASGAKSMVFKATHVAGTGGNASSRTITYELYTSKSTSGNPIATKTGDNGLPVTFTDLDPGKTYYCYAYTTNLGNGDNNCWLQAGSTKEETKVVGNTGDVSATTLRASVSWNAPGASSVTCIISCNGQSKSLSGSGSYIGFTGLTPGSTYTVSWVITSTYIVNYTYTVIENGKEVTKNGSRTDVVETTGSTSFTTKKSQFNRINITSKIIQFDSNSNYSSDTMEHRISTDTYWDSIAQNTYVTYNNLTHNTQYTIYCRIAGCLAFDGNGSQTNTNDSEVSKSVQTHLLSLNGSINQEHQHSLVTLWQIYVDGTARDSDAVDGTLFRFTYMDTIARKSNPPYQAAEVTEGSNGSTSGDYQSDHKIYSNNLTWYYCEYIITASITDGYNVVASTVTAHTIFPASWIYSGGQWHRYMPNVYTNGKYVPAPIFVYENNRFIEPNGE